VIHTVSVSMYLSRYSRSNQFHSSLVNSYKHLFWNCTLHLTFRSTFHCSNFWGMLYCSSDLHSRGGTHKTPSCFHHLRNTHLAQNKLYLMYCYKCCSPGTQAHSLPRPIPLHRSRRNLMCTLHAHCSRFDSEHMSTEYLQLSSVRGQWIVKQELAVVLETMQLVGEQCTSPD